MRLGISVIVKLVVCLTLAGCISKSGHVTIAETDTQLERPAPGKALVVFFRVGHLNTHRAHAAIFDAAGDYIGTLAANTQITYQAEPGPQVFVSTSELTRFLEADLLAGKTYYVSVIPRGGLWKPNWVLDPQNGQNSVEQINKWLAKTSLGIVNDTGRRYGRDHKEEILNKVDRRLQRWIENTPVEKRPTLRPDSGI